MDLVGKSTADSTSLGGRSRCVVRPLNANRLSVWRGRRATPAARLNRCLDRSPIDLAVDLVVRCRLRLQIPIRLDL